MVNKTPNCFRDNETGARQKRPGKLKLCPNFQRGGGAKLNRSPVDEHDCLREIFGQAGPFQ